MRVYGLETHNLAKIVCCVRGRDGMTIRLNEASAIMGVDVDDVQEPLPLYQPQSQNLIRLNLVMKLVAINRNFIPDLFK